METGQRDELELVAHLRERRLEARDVGIAELLLPVERRRAVVCQHLARELRMDGIGKTLRLFHVGFRGLTPDQIGIRRVGQAARDGRTVSYTDPDEAFARPLA